MRSRSGAATAVVREPVTGICGLFWIISDSHTWRRNLYQTKLTLSLEALMDSQTAGSEPKKIGEHPHKIGGGQ